MRALMAALLLAMAAGFAGCQQQAGEDEAPATQEEGGAAEEGATQ